MGCDIHVYLERRYSKGPWQLDPKHRFLEYEGRKFIVAISSFSGRNYNFFGRVAGVRSLENPVVPPRGFPKDASKELQEYFEPSHYHTPTWLSPKEMLRALKKFEKDYGRYYYNEEPPADLLWSGKPELAFNEDNHTIDNSALLYIERELAIHDIDRKLLNDKRKLEFRFVIWFDS